MGCRLSILRHMVIFQKVMTYVLFDILGPMVIIDVTIIFGFWISSFEWIQGAKLIIWHQLFMDCIYPLHFLCLGFTIVEVTSTSGKL